MIMKRISTLIVALVAIATTANAQLKFGVEAGLNVNMPSSFDNSTIRSTVDPKNSLGWFAGLKAKYQLPLGLGVDGAVLFSQMKNDFGESDKTLQYINVPINLRYQIGLGGLLSIYLAAGPQWSVNIGDRDWSLGDVENASGLFETYYTSAVKQHNISANLGAGVLLLKHIQVGFTYNIPITKGGEMIYSNPVEDVDGVVRSYEEIRENWKNNTWQIRAAYFF